MLLGFRIPTKTVRFIDTVKPISSSSSSSCLSVAKPYSLCNFAPETLIAMKAPEESDVGIFCFISDLPGFRGVLKQRYSDFIVNEVDPDGNVVHLTSLEAPPEPRDDCKIKNSDASSGSYVSELESFRSLAGDSDAELLKALIDQINSGGGEDCISPIVLSPSSDKARRTEIHNFFKTNLKFLVTDTTDGPDASSKCIRVRLNNSGQSNQGRNSRKRKERGGKPFDSRGSENWQDNVGKFLRFHLYKENKDSQEAIGLLGKMLGIQPKSFGFAGTKDKRAVTTQRVTVFKLRASRLAVLNDRLIGIKVGNFCYVNEGLVLGQLSGNRFTVTLRGVVADSEDIVKASAAALGKQGFINYFGLQRFGSGSVPTFLVGAVLLRGEWKAAVDLILDPREGEKREIMNAREYYKETSDIDGTMRQLPRFMVAERALLQCLKKCPGNYLQALRGIPRTMRMMYVHSYQSYLWNHGASTRVQKYGTDNVVVGDLVYCKESDAPSVKDIATPVAEDEDSNNTLPNDLDETTVTDIPEEKNISVKAVTEQDILSGKYTIEDVVLPMPGSRVILPQNDVAQVYNDLANKDNISLTESAHGVKEFSITSMTGSYRRVFQKPLNYEWEFLTYTDSTVPLAETDMDIMAKSRPAEDVKEDKINGNEETSMNNGNDRSEVPTGNNSEEPQKAIKLSFTLPASCYATMAIRELLKTSTSTAFHKTLN